MEDPYRENKLGQQMTGRNGGTALISQHQELARELSCSAWACTSEPSYGALNAGAALGVAGCKPFSNAG